MDEFVNLHVHSHYSILDGKSTPDELAQRAAELGQPAVAMTDHGSLGGAYKHYTACIKAGVKPIIGMEAYVAPGSRLSREALYWGRTDQRRDDVSGSGKYTHITLLALSDVGVRNLFRLHGDSFSRGFYGQPRVDLESLAACADGVAATTGCLGGATQTLLRLGLFDRALQHASDLKDIFSERMFVEIMEHDIPIEQMIQPQLIEIARRLNLPLLATADSHYTLAEEADIHDTLLCIQTKAKKSHMDRFRFNGHGYHLLSEREVTQRLGGHGEAIRNTVHLADSVEEYRVFESRPRMPKYDGVDGDADFELDWQIETSNRIDHTDPVYDQRLCYERDVIVGLGFSPYFMVLKDLLDRGRNEGIRFGPGRGSASGSLVGYALGITDVDPIEHGLLFERFLNPERISFPDIDVDIEDEKRDQFLSIVRMRVGEDKVAQIGTNGSIGAKSAIKDSVRALDYPYTTGLEIVGRLPAARAGRQPTLDDLPRIESYKEVIDCARGIEGTIRSKGVHASGVVISPDDLPSLIPLWHPRKGGKPGAATSMFDMHDLEALGFIKYDFLGSATLGVIDETLLLLNGGTKPGFSLPKTLDDPRVYELLSSGQTAGVFQLDGHGMRKLLRRLQPTSFGDICAVLALYRPGPMGANAHQLYADRKNQRSRVEPIHQEFEAALATTLRPTYGIIVYQEQVLEVLRIVGGYTYGSAELIFNAMRKKDLEKMEAAHPEFVERLTSNGYSDGAITALWEILVPFADYSFNKSHSVGYGMVAYWCAYLLAHHPREYFCALLTREKDPETLRGYIRTASRTGIPILPPDVNSSGFGWTLTDEGIRFGFGAIKGVASRTYAALDKGRPYLDITDFFARVDSKFLNVGVLKASVQCGSFDSIEPNRESLYNSLEALAARAIEDRTLTTGRLWGKNYTVPKSAKSLDKRQRWEREVLGLALTQRRVTIRFGRRPEINEIYYLMAAVAACPGTQPLDIEVAPGTVLKNIAKINLTEGAITKLNVLGFLIIEEEE